MKQTMIDMSECTEKANQAVEEICERVTEMGYMIYFTDEMKQVMRDIIISAIIRSF